MESYHFDYLMDQLSYHYPQHWHWHHQEKDAECWREIKHVYGEAMMGALSDEAIESAFKDAWASDAGASHSEFPTVKQLMERGYQAAAFFRAERARKAKSAANH